jgi:hypothetical protein
MCRFARLPVAATISFSMRRGETHRGIVVCESGNPCVGHELIAAGRLILAAGGKGTPLDYGELERWTRLGYERGTAFRRRERMRISRFRSDPPASSSIPWHAGSTASTQPAYPAPTMT